MYHKKTTDFISGGIALCRLFLKLCLMLYSGNGHRPRYSDDPRQQGMQTVPAVRHHGSDAGLRRCFSSCAPCCSPVHHRLGKLYGGAGYRKAYHVCYHDAVLCSSLLCLALTLSHQRSKRIINGRMAAGSCANRLVPYAAERMDRRNTASLLGHLPQHSLRHSRRTDCSIVFQKHPGESGQALPASMAHGRT